MSKLAKKIKNSWSAALATLIYPLGGFCDSVSRLFNVPQTLSGSDES